ncbi:ricin-type beta-trefoil lectin domain protein [Kitasatospora sp. NPDC059673]|uniref:ricin-type beta-trefoil lectin domain protein n=1 Tax=Kitasatospora sp. NPDC059673 TaxID=3346901 RepID=UPI0036CD4BC6
MLGRATVAAATALVLTALSSPAAWAADPAPVPTPTGGTETAPPPAESEHTKAIRAALQQAGQTGKPVRIDSMTNETTEVFADTDGRSLHSEAHAQDVRTKRNGSWQTLDATLHRNANGTVSPALTGADLVLSGGGSGPLAMATGADGVSMSISSPFPLPTPTLDGATAVYASVLPDVDLRVTAHPDGGWRDVIVVKTAQAAADPRLKSLHFPLQTTGMKASADAAGNISFTDAQGNVRVHAPTPFQWDSSTAPAPSPLANPGATQPKSMFAAPVAAATATADVSTPDAPGTGAVVSTIGVSVSDTELVLTPDPATFGKGTGPWYLDPDKSITNHPQINAQVQENHPDTANVNTLSNLGVGYCGYSDCTGYGRYRAYYQMSTPDGLFEGGSHGTATVNEATLFVDVTSAAAPDTKSTINLYSTPAFQGTTTWNNQPCGTNGKMAGCTWVGNSDVTNTGRLSYDVKSWMQLIVNGKYPNWTIGFSADDEYDKALRHHLSSDPYIVTKYDIAPTIWWPRTTPQPGFVNDPALGTQGNDCQTPGGGYAWYQPGWVGANQNIYLTANIWSPIGATVTAKYHLWDDTDKTAPQLYPSTTGGGSYGPAPVAVGGLADGHQYGWNAYGDDTQLRSGETPWCYFRVDKTPPQVSIASTDFPASGTIGALPKKKVREAGSFTVAAQDPAPGPGLGASGVACIRWSTDPTAVTGWSCDAAGVPNNNGVVKGSSGTFPFTPTTWGTNTLFVQAMDVAGNYSQPMPYTFYAPWDPSIGTGTPGDLNADGRGDILLPDDLGNLRVVGLDSDATTSQAAPLGLAPGGTSWKSDPAAGVTVRTTHLGALREMPAAVDDAVVWTSATPSGGTSLAKNLYLYQNNGDGTFKAPVLLPKPTSWVGLDGAPLTAAPAGWNSTWTGLTQVVSLGSLNAGLNDNDSLTTINQTSILTVEGGNLWLYRTEPTNKVNAPALKVSGADWSNYELINPGAASGTAQPTLWTRDKTDGTIRAHDIKLNAGGFLDFGNLADPTSKARVVGTQKFTVSAYPQLGSSGDATKDGLPDLWALDAANHLKVWPGAAATGSTMVTGFGSTPADQGDTRRALGRVKLDNAAVTDVYGRYPMTASSAVTFPTDTVNGTSTTVAHFAGKNSSGVDSGSVIDYSATQTGRLTIDTSKSFTVSVWAKPGTADGSKQGPVLSTKGTASSGFTLGPDQDSNWHFSMATSDNTSKSYDTTSSSGSSAARFQQDRWDRLTASYNAGTGVMTLYVNGMLAGSAVHSGKFGYNAPLVIGNYQNAGGYAASFDGNISDAVVYDVPTNPGSITGRLVADLPTAVGADKCLDANGSVDANGTAIQVWDCSDSTAQKATAQPNGTIKILSRCLDVTGAATGNGVKIQLWNCDGNPAQQWVFRADGSLFNPMSGRCLDMPNGNIANGTQLQIWDCNQSYAQRWRSGAVA